MQRIEQAAPVRSAVAAALAVLALTSCGDDAHKAAPSPTPSHLVSVADSCGGAFRTEATTAAKLLGASQVTIGAAGFRPTLEQAAISLKAAVPGGGGGSTNPHTLCAVHPKGSTVWFDITFTWGQNNGASPTTESTPDSSEYNGIGYQASSQDDEVLIDFSCVMRSATSGVADGRGMYIKATADTDGLNALPSAQKREAQVRVLHAASVSVATAMGCSTNLPKTLGRLTPLPLAS
jgi:hypothetical protein